MTRKIIYWVSTGLVGVMSLFAAFAYLSGSPQAVQGFAHVGYPQQLRIILGIAKLLGAIILVESSLYPASPKSRSGPMLDSPLRGSRHLLRTIWRKMVRKRSCR